MEELLNIKDDYERALTLVNIAFKNIKDRAGKPYIGHLIRVSERFEDKDTKIAGLLHDTLEDIDYIDEKCLSNLNFNKNIIDIIKIVSKNPNDKNYHDFITRVINSNNINAIKVKYADMLDNYDLNRIKELPKDEQEYLINKYSKEIIRLKKIVEGRE
ncbi:MAG: hypothetical protein ACI4WW_01985 [Candidatus Coprovivens sp.]